MDAPSGIDIAPLLGASYFQIVTPKSLGVVGYEETGLRAAQLGCDLPASLIRCSCPISTKSGTLPIAIVMRITLAARRDVPEVRVFILDGRVGHD